MTRGCPVGSPACTGSTPAPPVMISSDFTESSAVHPPIAAAASSIKVRPAAGPVGAADEQADKNISRVNAIANIDTSATKGSLRQDGTKYQAKCTTTSSYGNRSLKTPA